MATPNFYEKKKSSTKRCINLTDKWQSLLLHAIVSNATYAPNDGLRRADFETIGTLSFVQLSELRHRGAFSTVAQTFAACCLRCAENKNSEISSLPDMWYQVSKIWLNEE